MPHDDFLHLQRSLRLQWLGVEAAAVAWEMVGVADVQQLTNGAVRTKQRMRISDLVTSLGDGGQRTADSGQRTPRNWSNLLQSSSIITETPYASQPPLHP
jgi:hypothetical protein